MKIETTHATIIAAIIGLAGQITVALINARGKRAAEDETVRARVPFWRRPPLLTIGLFVVLQSIWVCYCFRITRDSFWIFAWPPIVFGLQWWNTRTFGEWRIVHIFTLLLGIAWLGLILAPFGSGELFSATGIVMAYRKLYDMWHDPWWNSLSAATMIFTLTALALTNAWLLIRTVVCLVVGPSASGTRLRVAGTPVVPPTPIPGWVRVNLWLLGTMAIIAALTDLPAFLLTSVDTGETIFFGAPVAFFAMQFYLVRVGGARPRIPSRLLHLFTSVICVAWFLFKFMSWGDASEGDSASQTLYKAIGWFVGRMDNWAGFILSGLMLIGGIIASMCLLTSLMCATLPWPKRGLRMRSSPAQ